MEPILPIHEERGRHGRCDPPVLYHTPSRLAGHRFLLFAGRQRLLVNSGSSEKCVLGVEIVRTCWSSPRLCLIPISDRRFQHVHDVVTPWIWHSGLPVRRHGVRGGSRRGPGRAAAQHVSVRGLRFGGRGTARKDASLVSALPATLGQSDEMVASIAAATNGPVKDERRRRILVRVAIAAGSYWKAPLLLEQQATRFQGPIQIGALRSAHSPGREARGEAWRSLCHFGRARLLPSRATVSKTFARRRPRIHRQNHAFRAKCGAV